MAVSLCLRLSQVDEVTIRALLVALVHVNMQLYRELDLPAPWSLRWVPDAPAASSQLRDVVLLSRVGSGSCGELAAAYAAWLWEREHRSNVRLELLRQGPDSWHVAAADGQEIWDPQVIGATHATQ